MCDTLLSTESNRLSQKFLNAHVNLQYCLRLRKIYQPLLIKIEHGAIAAIANLIATPKQQAKIITHNIQGALSCH